jgi:hypothetical protein
MPDSRLHVAVHHNASRLRSPDDRLSIDSALYGTAAGRRLLTLAQLADILDSLPAKYAGIARQVDIRSQSGLETLAWGTWMC